MTESPFEAGVEPPASPSPDARLVLAQGMDVFVEERDGQARIPARVDAERFADGVHFIGRRGETDYYASPVREDVPVEGLTQLPARSLFGRVDETTLGIAGRAIAIAEWDRTHRFCGRCATPTLLVPGERARRCPVCRIPFYPRLSPAVIVLVRRGAQALLARNATFPRPWFSTLAGFVEPGESLEEAVIREVKEEVGIDVADVRYFGSQPWPFGRSLMIGFTATYAGGELRADGTEIAEARWFDRDLLPEMPPKFSIARQLIDAWVRATSA
ncbi:MAG: NAD(+) diphosphatase [Myxococcaceae bacterium]